MADICHKVRFVHQTTSSGCWAAAAAMVLGKPVGPGAAKLDKSGGLINTEWNWRLFAMSHGMRLITLVTYTLDGLARLLQSGPLMVAGKLKRAGGHAYVIAGVRGQNVYILDPLGNVGWVNYSRLMTTYPFATVGFFQKITPTKPAGKAAAKPAAK